MKFIQSSLLFAGACLLLLVAPSQAQDERMDEQERILKSCPSGLEFFEQIPMEFMHVCVAGIQEGGDCGHGATADAQCWAGEVVNCAMEKAAAQAAALVDLVPRKMQKFNKEGCPNVLKMFMALPKETVAPCTSTCNHCSTAYGIEMGCWAKCVIECSMGNAAAKVDKSEKQARYY